VVIPGVGRSIADIAGQRAGDQSGGIVPVDAGSGEEDAGGHVRFGGNAELVRLHSQGKWVSGTYVRRYAMLRPSKRVEVHLPGQVPLSSLPDGPKVRVRVLGLIEESNGKSARNFTPAPH
jgi:hypothetical protein